MASPSIRVTYDRAINDIRILENYRRDSLSLEPKFQHFVAEVVLLRLFSIIEISLKETAMKLACQASYRNGTSPTLFINCKSTIDAENQFMNFNRAKPTRLSWTNAKYIKDSIKKVIPHTEPYRTNLIIHSATFEEMRKVRNHVAHRARSTYTNYKLVVNTTFGANLNIQPGPFLTSIKRIPVAKIDYYIGAAKIILNDVTNG
ncbi:hypothetical protein [Maribacter sp. Asnod2-G09]|uniref:hypothetical protein n=1 Tax=Maribacter sp. Asnod2-G09 TaxID=3160577 RepID=UPI00386895C6